MRNSSLQLASEEQSKADKNVLKLVAEQKVCLFTFIFPCCIMSTCTLQYKLVLLSSHQFLLLPIYHDIYCNLQKEKEEALKKVLELERNLAEKQTLEMEIQELKGKLDVMKHMGGDDDAVVQQKMKEFSDLLQEKKENLESMEDLNLQLIVKERQSNDELQEARKELIAV